MKARHFALLGLSLLATAGCRTDPAIALLERDNYRKEQEIWRLRGCIEDLQDALDSCPERQEGSSRSGAAADGGRAPRDPCRPPCAPRPRRESAERGNALATGA